MSAKVSLDLRLEALAEALSAAAVGQLPWQEPLQQFATLTGAYGAELLCLGRSPSHIIANGFPELVGEFARLGGHDPTVNSRIRHGMAAPPLVILDEADVETRDDMRRHPEYGDLIRRAELEYVCLTTLTRGADETIGLSSLRSRQAGNITIDEKRIFGAAARHFRNALRMQSALEDRAITLVAGAFEQTGAAAFMLDRRGFVRAHTASAEALVAGGDLRILGRRLCLRDPADRSLDRAIERACMTRSVADCAASTAVARDAQGLAYPIDVTPLAKQQGMLFDAAVLVVARPPRPIEARAAQIATLLYGLTGAEGAVAGLLAAGVAPAAIAERQRISIGTVRTHIHRILEKAGARGQVEFVAALLART